MKARFVSKLKGRQRLGYLLIGTAFAGITIALFFSFFIGLNTVSIEDAKASTSTTFPSGSFIVKMGITPQTVANGLKPHGLIYDLIVNYKVPVHWVIEPSKAQDGVDFNYLGVDYKGGPFVIDKRYINAAVYNRILYWMGQGVQGIFTISDLTVPVYHTIQYYPKVLVDNLSGNEPIVAAYFANAGIPSSAYTVGTPDDANQCVDVWVNPHGDPDWSSHSNLKTFSTVHRGFIWSQCHAVSELEGSANPSDLTEQMNFLTIDGMKCWHWNLAKCGPMITEEHPNKQTKPYNFFYPSDPVMQFVGTPVPAIDANGSEKWYMPQSTGGWRNTTKRLITTSDSISPFEGVQMAYGPAYGDSANGWVMYESGHDLQGGPSTVENQVAAQRAFFNFLLLCGKERQPLVTSSIDAEMTGLNWYNFSVAVSGGNTPYTYSWSSSIGGVFFNPDSSHTGYRSPYVTSPTTGIITCVISDSCSRVMAINQFITISPSPLPVTLTEFTATPQGMDKVVVSWKTSSEMNNRYFTVERSKNLQNYTVVGNVPTLGNGTIPHNYTLNDYEPYAGKSYYRLSQTDNNGDIKYYDPVVVNRNALITPQKLTVGPNPFRDQFNLTINYDGDRELNIRMYDLNGRLIREEMARPSGATTAIRFTSLDNLPKGNYILKVEDGVEFSELARLIKR